MFCNYYLSCSRDRSARNINIFMNKNDYKVLFLFPNERHVSIVPPSIAILSGLLKSENFSVDLFDTSLYPTEGLDSDEIREKNLSVRAVKDSDKVKLKQKELFIRRI
jgi:hypothetical protein